MKTFVILALFLARPALAQVYFSPSKIIGTDDSRAVDADGTILPRPMAALIDAVGKGSNGCTMTHIGRGYAISAGHCFSATTEVTKGSSCEGLKIQWGFREGKAPYLYTDCSHVVAMQNNLQIDFAIIKMDQEPRASIELDLKNTVPDLLKITFLSHPQGQPLRWSQYCVIEEGRHPDISHYFFNYKCDSEAGSSGAAILDAVTLKIVGIHKGGMRTMNYGSFVNQSPLKEILQVEGF